MHIFYFAYIMIWKFPCNTKIYHQQGYNDYNDYKQELQKTGHKHKIFLYSSCPFFISPLLTVLYYRMNVKKPIHCKKQVKDFSVSLTYHSFNFKSITYAVCTFDYSKTRMHNDDLSHVSQHFLNIWFSWNFLFLLVID